MIYQMINRNFIFSFLLILSFIYVSSASAAELALPSPQTEGGLGLFDALKKRASVPGGDFSAAEVRLDELSTLLWAASGLNRGEKGWTVPMARGRAPYVRIYVAAPDGVFLYDWSRHSLKEISSSDIKAKIGAQSFVRKAFYALVFVSDQEALEAFKEPGLARDFSQMLVGAMSQDLYLAAAALKLGARYVHSINAGVIKSELKLEDGDEPIGLMLLGK